MLEASEAFAAKLNKSDLESLRSRLTALTCRFSQHLATQGRACLAQIWVPDAEHDGSVTLHTQGVPFAVAGCADLLALFRCVSCRYKFGTDTSKPALMGAVGRVFMTGKPEMSHNVQQFDKTQFLRVDEAQRCRVHSALFMPLYAAAARRHPFAVFEVVPADTDVPFPVLVQWLKCCLQEVQLYTADATQTALTTMSRAPAMSPASESDKLPSNGQEPARQTPSATMTHCSASSLHEQRYMKAAKQGSPISAAEGLRPAGRVHEVSADSEEEKICSSVTRSSRSPDSSSALLAGSCGASFSNRQRPRNVQSASGGSLGTPALSSGSKCLPAQLVAIGNTLQLQTSCAPKDLQPPFSSHQPSAPDVATSVAAAVAAQSPSLQSQQQQQLQRHQQQQQQQMQFLAHALQLQSQLKAHTQSQPGGSAFAGYQAFSPTPPAARLGSLLQQHSAPVPHDEEDAGDEEVQVNNRVAGGAGKRLSVDDLQSQFGVGLREAAHNLRICPTTLKRACRRHGIYRWPRRQSWAGGGGDDCRTDSMNLDGDFLYPAGVTTGPEPPSSAAPLSALGQQRLSGLLSSWTSGLLALHTPVPGPGQGPLQGQLASPGTGHLPGHLAGQGHLPGPRQGPSALEGFQGLDSAAKIALLQRLTAAKAGPADKEWAKGNGLSNQPPGPLSTAPALTTSAVTGWTMPARQLGSGHMASMLATGLDRSHTPQLAPTASHPPSTMQGKATTLPYSGMLPSQTTTSPSTLLAPASQQRHSPFMDRQTCTPGLLPGFSQQGISQQGISQQGVSQQGMYQRDAYRQPPGSLPAALSGTSSFTSMALPQALAAQPGMSMPWQHQTHAQTTGAVPLLGQQNRLPAPAGPRGVEPPPVTQLQAAVSQAATRFLPAVDAQHFEMPSSSVKSECQVEKLGSSVVNEIGLETSADMEGGSWQGRAAMEFAASDHGLGSLDFLGDAGLDLDHPGVLDFDPADCMF